MRPVRDFSVSADRRAWKRDLLGPLDDAKWNELALELFAWQFARVPAYRRLCVARGAVPGELSSWKEIPAVPQQLFKRETLHARGLPAPTTIYETSGTTTGEPGRHHLSNIDLYRAVALEGARRAGFLDGGPDLHFLTPSPAEAPHSSLSAMFGFWRAANGKPTGRFWVRKGKFDFDGLRSALAAAIRKNRPLAICGTAFSFVHLIDAWADLPPLRLPAQSRLLETGGFKGRSREVPKAELYAEMGRLFTVPDDAIWNEYGMSELSSQAYGRGTSTLHRTPNWARVLVWDPAHDREAAPGQCGLVRWIDLANTDSVLAVQTLDVAERTAPGFRLIGRLPRTEPRGCSLDADDLAAHTA